MWVPKALVELFSLTRDTVNSTKEELAAVRAERDALQRQLNITQVNFDWIRMQINTLQLERTALIEKCYNIKLPAPEIVRTPVVGAEARLDEFTFDDLGDKLAARLGFPMHDTKQ